MRTLTLALLVTGLAPSSAFAAWPTNPAINLPVASMPGDQSVPRAVDDGAGGAIIAWTDDRGADRDIYALRIDVLGNASPGWPATGVPVCTATGDQDNPVIVSDGSGGAVIAWTDRRGADADIYAVRIRDDGSRAAGWAVDGEALCTAAGDQGPTRILEDGGGGAFVAWRDARMGEFDIYAVRVRSNGNLTGSWPANGLGICTAPGDQRLSAVATDRRGGMFVAWQDERSGELDIYANRIRSNGRFPGGWGLNGRAVCTVAGDQFAPAITGDGDHGCYIVWEDFRLGGTSDLYGVRLLENGQLAAGWPFGGTPLCTAPGDQLAVQMIQDGWGNAILAWEDYRNGLDNADIFALKVRTNGARFWGWPANGLAVCTAADHQGDPVLASDGFFGALVLWNDYRSGVEFDVYAKRLGWFGIRPNYWSANGIPVSNAAGNQTFAAVAGARNVIVAWDDDRGGAGSDIYAQRLEIQGTLGNNATAAPAVQPAPGNNAGRVRLAWGRSTLDTGPPAAGRIGFYRVRRNRFSFAQGPPLEPGMAPESPADRARPAMAGAPSVLEDSPPLPASLPPGLAHALDAGEPISSELPPSDPGASTPEAWEIVASLAATGQATYVLDVDLPPSPPSTPGYGSYRIEAVLHDDESTTWMSETGSGWSQPGSVTGVGIAAPPNATLASPSPNPARVHVRFDFTLARTSVARLDVFDVKGQRVRALIEAQRGAGAHAVTWDRRDLNGRRVPAGVYFARLNAGGFEVTRRFAVVD